MPRRLSRRTRPDPVLCACAGEPAPGTAVSDFGVNSWLDQLRAAPGIRVNKVRRVRRAIAAGTYENSLKLTIAVERMLREEWAHGPSTGERSFRRGTR
jgi:hypothetical protein